MTDVRPGTWSVVGHERTIKRLVASVDTPAHAYLLVGPRSIGKRTVGIEFAKALNCEEEPRPCHSCHSCRMIRGLGHPDVLFVEPEDKQHVSIDQVRELRRQLLLRPSEGRWRVVIVRADMLTENASDAILKTLEEPNSQVVLVLTSSEVGGLPATLVSRCRVLSMGFVPTDAVVDLLATRGVSPETARHLANLSFGAIGWAIRALTDADGVKRRERIRADIVTWGTGPLLARLALAESATTASRQLEKTRTMVTEELELLLAWWRDVIVSIAGSPELVVDDEGREAVTRFAQQESLSAAMGAIRSVAEAARRISQNVDPRLALEAMAVSR